MFMDYNSEEKWFIAQIKPNSYNKAKNNLQQQGFETFLPTLELTKRNSNRCLYNSIYLFPGYMFVAFNPLLIKWTKINNTFGVSKILTFNGKPEVVSSDLILELKGRCDANDKFLSKEHLQGGDKIKILTGPFSNFIAKIENENYSRRKWALLDFMGQTRRLDLNNKNIVYQKL